MASTLIKDIIASDKSGNEWMKKLLILIKSVETPTIYKYIKSGGWGENWAIPVFKDEGNGASDMGFGNQNAIASYPIRITKGTFKFSKGFPDSKILKTATIHSKELGSDKMKKSGAFSSNDICVAYHSKAGVITSLEQVSLMCNMYLYEAANRMWALFNNKEDMRAVLHVMYDHEFFALLDLHYNIGEGWTTVLPSLRAAVIRHQQAKIDKDTKAEADALQDVKNNFVKACYTNHKENATLKIRRTKTANMYGGGAGGMSDYYDDDSKWGSTVESIYKDIPASAMINITLDQAVKEEAAVSSLSAMVGTGYNPKLLALYGSDKSIEQILKESKAEDLAAKKKDAITSNPVNKKAVTAAAQAVVNDDINNLEFIADMRALSGLTVPSQANYSRANAMSDTDRARANMTHNYGMFKKYKHTNDADLGQAKTTWFFLTRPDMCLYQNTGSDRRSNVNFRRPSLQCMDQDLLDHLIIDRDLYIYLDRNVAPEHADTNTCFIPAFTNQFKTTNLPEARFEMTKSSANINGVAVNIPTYNSSDTADTEIPVTFNVDDEMSVIKYIDIIFKYAKSVKEGLTIPYKESIKYNVIDFSMTMFAFVVGQDGVTLESMYRSVGVVPSVNPISSLPLSSNPEKMDGVTVSFKTNTNLDSRKMSTITHFNMLNRYGCTYLKLTKVMGKIVTYDDAIDWYCLNYNIIEAYVQDNMTAEDWYCERFIIYLDANTKQENGGVYKLIGIPPMKRLEQILDFLLNKSHNTFYNTLIVREVSGQNTAEFKLRPGIASLFYKRIPDIGAIQKETAKFVDSLSTTDFYKGWQAMSRQADADMRGDSEFYRNPGTGIRVLSNSKDRGTDGTMIFNLFRTIQEDIPARNNMYDLFLDDKGEVRDMPAWMGSFYNFLNGSLLNRDAGKITNVITYAITGEMTYSLDNMNVDPLKSNLGHVGSSDNDNTVYNKYRKGVKKGLVYHTENKDGSMGITLHKFNTIDKIDSLGLFVDGLYIPTMNDSSKDIYAQIEKLENTDTMKRIKKDELELKYYVNALNEASDAMKAIQLSDNTIIPRFKTDVLLSLGVKKKDVSTDDYNNSSMMKHQFIKEVIGNGATFFNTLYENSMDKNPHFIIAACNRWYPPQIKIDEMISKTWTSTKSSRGDINDLNKVFDPTQMYLSMQPDKTTIWKENSGVAPYLVTENGKLVAYNTKAVRVKKEYSADKKTGTSDSTRDMTKIATIDDKSNITQNAYLNLNSQNRYDLISFMNSSIFQKQFTINDWISFYMPQGINSEGKPGAIDSITMDSGDKVLMKYHNIMYVSEWTKSAPVRYSDKGMQIHYSIGDIPTDKIKDYADFLYYYDVVMDDMSDGAIIEKENKAKGTYDKTDKANKLFSYYPEDMDITPKEVREKDSWITKEGWKNRAKNWWGNLKTTVEQTLWDQAILLTTQSLEKLVRGIGGDKDEDRKDGKPVDNPLSELSSAHKSYVKVIERSEHGINKPRALYFKDESTDKIKSGLPEVQAESEIKPIPTEYYRSNIKLMSPEIQNNISKVISETTTTSKILKLLRDM